MPFINVKTNAKILDSHKEELKAEFGKNISLLPGKSEHWLMVSFEDEKSLYFQGSAKPCALIEVKIYGKSNENAYANLTKSLTDAVSKKLAIPQERIYVEYEETPYWGFAGENF